MAPIVNVHAETLPSVSLRLSPGTALGDLKLRLVRKLELNIPFAQLRIRYRWTDTDYALKDGEDWSIFQERAKGLQEVNLYVELPARSEQGGGVTSSSTSNISGVGVARAASPTTALSARPLKSTKTSAGIEPTSRMSAIRPREVAVAIPVDVLPWPDSRRTPPPRYGVDASLLRVYLVSSRKHDGKWVLPKGGIEDGENARQAALREMWEEAGIIGEPDVLATPSLSDRGCRLLHIKVDDHKPHKDSPGKHADEEGFVPRARYIAMELLISHTTDVKDDWPEKHERQRKVFTLEEAEKQLAWRQDLHTIFKIWKDNLPEATNGS
ncbi:NUDIX hydrolase domain protein [Kalmanozyma brasiliensis GHG001]|uniref:NUDIX hydrolase domain protein n=1 Tax=Kalmanozyma brasiliensis (strain GHG001) TaxID=1365824 RepID=UPI002867DB4A|nr:NUDIX hydrolase domain protein [Kalmanozyma brasiliensis GHG001]EST06129.2 NUDIX hydrolase domain protein [Kalmanozyma brasiliensis GHG001]